jgi:LysR family hydrogen peroxide-inducible transcriptional activator
MFSIREVEYVLEIAKQASISKAAASCNVSQPALTMQINKLENVLGFKIFERERNKNIATAKGRELIDHFEKIFAEFKKIKVIKNGDSQLRIGIIPTVAPYLLPKIIGGLKTLKKQFYFFEQQTEIALQNLQAGELDLVILAFYPKIIPDNLLYKKLYLEEFFFVTEKSVDVSVNEGVKSDKIILLEEGNCINESIEGICNLKQNKGSFAATSIEVVKAMILAKNGYGILPKMALENGGENFRVKSFSPKKYREIGVCYRKNFADKNLVEILANIH